MPTDFSLPTPYDTVKMSTKNMLDEKLKPLRVFYDNKFINLVFTTN